MTSRLRLAHRFFVALIALTVITTPANAQDVAGGGLPRVRGASLDAAHLLEELFERSATGRKLVEQLDRSDLTVFIRYEWFPTNTLHGRIGVLASSGRRRLFAIEIDSHQTRIERLATLGHELQHAVEIAGAASVQDARTLAAFYTSIGQPSGTPGSETYETAAAIAIGRRVRQELITPPLPADPAVLRD